MQAGVGAQDGGEGKDKNNKVKRGRKRQHQHLKAHHKARKATLEQTQHKSPQSMNTQAHINTQTK